VAFTEYASRFVDEFTYGFTSSPVNSTATNGAPPDAAGSTG
jgi:hypothetical protein